MLTVAMPIWNSKRIAWLAFESLCRQKDAGYWELLIMEEQAECFGKANVKKYAERLAKVGCVDIRYFALNSRYPLPMKWQYMGRQAHKDSDGFVLHSADCWSDSGRLARTAELLNQADWVQQRMTYFYSIHYGKMMKFDQKTFGAGCRTGACMAIRTDKVRDLPDYFQHSGIDTWLLKHVGDRIKWIDDDIPSLDTDDLNNISLTRRKHYHSPRPPFTSTDKTLNDLLPDKIADRLTKTLSRWK